ncbi:MAG: hypothetical protein WCY25_01545 [Moheibacter sp.]
MKLKPFHYYAIGFVVAVTIGFIVKEYMGFVIAGGLYAILLGLIVSIFNFNPVEKSPYDKRKKD